MSATVGITVKSASNLDAKDLNGKSDPYCVIGVIDSASGQWIGKPTKTAVKHANLNPHWSLTERASFHAKVTDASNASLRIQVWDEDKIGKDEFMGEVVIPLKQLKEDTGLYQGNTQESTSPLAGRAGSSKTVGGTVLFSYSYLTETKRSEWESESSKDFESQRRKLELEAENRRIAAAEAKMRRQQRVESLINEYSDDMDIDLQTVEEAARLVSGRGGTTIENKSALRSILTQLGTWDAVRRYAFWANSRIIGESSAAQDLNLKAAIEGDKDVAEAEMDRAWCLFDHDANGQIEFRELLVGLGMISNAKDIDRAKFFFDLFDVDKSGTLSKEEVMVMLDLQWKQSVGSFCAVVESRLKQDLFTKRQSVEDMMDQLRKTIWDKVDGSNRMAAALFDKADKNNDGSISRDEYLDFVANSAARAHVQQACVQQIERVAALASPLIANGIKQIIETGHAMINHF